MTTRKVRNGKPYVGSPSVRFDEGVVASEATPRHGVPLYSMRKMKAVAITLSGKAAFVFSICAAATFSPLFAEMNLIEKVTLTEDTDWTSHGMVNLSGGVVVDLNGHDLRVGGLSGTGRFVSSADELIVNGSFEQIVGETSSSAQGFSETVYPTGWTAEDVAGAASLGCAKSKDTTWSSNLDAQDGGRSVWWWCSSKGGGATLTQKVVVDKADIYRLSFYTAYRPGSDTYKNMRIYVDVDGSTLGYAVCSTATWAESEFDVPLDVGEHYVTFRSDGTGGGGSPCGLLDNVSLRRKSCLRLGQSAEGMYSCQKITVDRNVIVLAESQTLNGDCDWSGLGEVNIAAGAIIDLAGYNLSMNGLTYDTEARKLDTELIVNGSFETLDGSAIESWAIDQIAGQASAFSSSNWCKDNKDGKLHVGFWINKSSNGEATISQAVDVPIAKTYRLSCWTKTRYGNYPAVTFKMSVDGTVRHSVTSQGSWQMAAVDVDLTAGKHVIAFTSSAYNSSEGPGGGIDLVSLRFPDAAITNSNDAAVSELRVNFASGSAANDRIALGGNLKLVKEGAGAFVSQKVQTYTGGTIIAAGTAQPPDPATQDAANTSARTFAAFGTGPITVAQGAVFDIRANYDYNELYNAILLDGGTLVNDKWAMTHNDWGGVGIGALTKDSSMNVRYTTVFGMGSGTLDLDTHRLSVPMTYGQVLVVRYPKIEDGTFAVSGTGWAYFGYACDIDAILEVNCPMTIAADVRVRDYVVNYAGNDSSGGNTLSVYGTFKPNTDRFYGCTLLDESTLDLSGRTTALPAEAVFANSKPSRLSVSFKEGATVTVHVDGRTDLKELSRTKENGAYAGYLMKWNTRPDASVKFVLDGDAARRYRLLCTDGGLVLCPSSGLEIVVR